MPKKRVIPEELMRLGILKFLADPANVEAGVIGAGGVLAKAPEGRHIDGERVLRELVDEGLVERRPTEYHRTAKPYFITQAGRDYLESSPPEMKEKLSAIDRKDSWVGKISDDRLGPIVSDVIRSLREFQDAPPRRISDVSREITEAITRSTSQDR